MKHVRAESCLEVSREASAFPQTKLKQAPHGATTNLTGAHTRL